MGDKFASRSRRCVFIGYSYNQKRWKLYDLETKKYFVSRDVKFIEHKFPFSEPVPVSPVVVTDEVVFEEEMPPPLVDTPVPEVDTNGEPAGEADVPNVADGGVPGVAPHVGMARLPCKEGVVRRLRSWKEANEPKSRVKSCRILLLIL